MLRTPTATVHREFEARIAAPPVSRVQRVELRLRWIVTASVAAEDRWHTYAR